MKMTYIRLLVDKFDECYAFYADVLGLEVTWGKPGEVYASFKAGETVSISLFKRGLMYEALSMPAPAPGVKTHDFVVVMEADDVDAAFGELTAKGAQTLNAPHDMPGWGSRCFHLTDPEGNLIEIYQELPKEKWDEGLRNHPDARNYD